MTKAPPYRIEALNSGHNRAAFSCGVDPLDRYFQTQVTQDIRRRIANCFVAISTETGDVAAYYTLASASIPTPDLPPEERKRLPRYPTMPAARIGRLAVDMKHRNLGLGRILIMDAAAKTLSAAPACYALLVDAKDNKAESFYQKHGFLNLAYMPRVLFLPLATAQKALLLGKDFRSTGTTK
ncbi:MAG: GNAT family N-acetyltransferase [Methylomonas sp.]